MQPERSAAEPVLNIITNNAVGHCSAFIDLTLEYLIACQKFQADLSC